MSDQSETVEAVEEKTSSSKPGQSKLNRMIARATKELLEKGYPKQNWKRDYEAGTAVYTCPNTGRQAFVNIVTREITGNAFENSANSEG